MKNEIPMIEFANAIKSVFKHDDIFNFIEIGCLDAKDSIFIKSQFRNCKPYAIEGLQDNYEKYLKKLPYIQTFNIIINEYDGVTNFHQKDINGLHSIFNRGYEYGENILVNKPCKTLKTFAIENNILFLDVLKIDVEGATFEVLKGAQEMLDTIKIMHIETEDADLFKGQKLHDKVVQFIENKFKMIDISKVVIQTDRHQYDSIWINKKLIK